MTRSEWICNTCGEGFETKGKRDGHRQRIHRQMLLNGVEKPRMKRSENGKFICYCGRDYTWPCSLQRHQKNCKDEILSEGTINDENVEQGIKFS
jgi:hypothetical protein